MANQDAQAVTKNKFDYNEIDMEALFIKPFTIPQGSNKHAQQEVPKNKFGYNEIDMEAFYASFESLETPSASQLSLKSTRFSEKTNNAIHTLQALLSNELSFLLRPIYSTMIKITIEYLLALPQNYTTFTYIRPPAVSSFSSLGLSTSCVLGGASRNEAISMTKTKSELQHLLQCFELWSVEYRNALSLSETTEAELSKASEVTNDLVANVKDFKVLDNDEKLVCNELACLQERKRKLKKEINIIDVQIANSTKKRDEIAKRKTELFVKGKVLKAEQDDVRIHVPRQKVEQELAEKTRYNIEAEWSKLRQQFI